MNPNEHERRMDEALGAVRSMADDPQAANDVLRFQEMRDRFAMAAIGGLAYEMRAFEAAEWAYIIADAMIEARKL